MNNDSITTIINFTRNVWRKYFPQHSKAPKTLCYDPLSLITGTHYGLCHLAHDWIYMTNWNDVYNPDDQILSLDPYDKITHSADHNDLTISDIPKLQELECILFISYDNLENTEQVLTTLVSKGVVIVINECIKLPREFVELVIETKPNFGMTISKADENTQERADVQSINAFMKI